MQRGGARAGPGPALPSLPRLGPPRAASRSRRRCSRWQRPRESQSRPSLPDRPPPEALSTRVSTAPTPSRGRRARTPGPVGPATCAARTPRTLQAAGPAGRCAKAARGQQQSAPSPRPAPAPRPALAPPPAGRGLAPPSAGLAPPRLRPAPAGRGLAPPRPRPAPCRPRPLFCPSCRLPPPPLELGALPAALPPACSPARRRPRSGVAEPFLSREPSGAARGGLRGSSCPPSPVDTRQGLPYLAGSTRGHLGSGQRPGGGRGTSGQGPGVGSRAAERIDGRPHPKAGVRGRRGQVPARPAAGGSCG